MKCPACAVENNDSAKFCKGCGAALAQLAAETTIPANCKTRSDCGFLTKPNAKFCPKCGELNPSQAVAASQKVMPQESTPVAPLAPIENVSVPALETLKATASPKPSHSAEIRVDSPVAPLPLSATPVSAKAASKLPLIPIVIALSVATLAGGIYYYKFSGSASHPEVGNSAANKDAPVITLPGSTTPQPAPEVVPAQPVTTPQPAPTVMPTPPVVAPHPSAKPAHPAVPTRGETAADRATLDKINNAIDNLGKNK